MKSLKEIMAKVALAPLPDHPQFGKHIGYLGRGRPETPIYEKTPGQAAELFRISHPKTAGTNDDLDQGFVDWMAVKASEDVVKVASCGADHKKLKSGERCGKCGEMSKTAAVSVQSLRNALEAGKTSERALEESVQKLIGKEKLKSALTGVVAGGGLTAGGGALYLKGRRDQRAKHAGLFGGNEHTERMARALKAAERKTGKKTENLKGWELQRALEESKPRRAKTAGVIENPENLDLLSRVRALAAAQNRALLGD